METRDFLFELGVEEIPAAHFVPACDWLQKNFETFIKESRLDFGSLLVSGTPRRFFVLATQVPVSQPDMTLERTGPAVKLAYIESGELSPAALGFLKKNGATANDIKIQKTDKGEAIAISLLQKGRTTPELIGVWVKDLLPQFPFPKKMVWKSRELAFSRPVRWICMLWGNETLQLETHGIKASNQSYGNRFLGLEKPFIIPCPQDYLPALEEHGVIAERARRLMLIKTSLENVFDTEDYSVVPDERLAETVCDLTEYPSAVLAQYEEEFLHLPEKIISSTISQNQKYFCVRDAEGQFSNRFVFISNGDPKKSDIIRSGNEKVVKARLADALWYFEQDCRQPLESYVPALEDVVFQARLGSMAAKVMRISQLCEWIADSLGLDSNAKEKVLRTALLAKADLVTNMLGEKEFTKLQGYIGKQYALASGEDEDVAEGIYEHYAPRGSNDTLPKSLTGALTAVADKMDTVCGIIGVGQMPTGSADPFALRRLANGVCQILLERGWVLEMESLVQHSFDVLKKNLELEADARQKTMSFFRQRAEWLFKQKDIAYDVLDSLAHLPIGAMASFYKQAQAITKIRESEDFTKLVIGFKRVANILSGITINTSCDPALFREAQESRLYEHLAHLQPNLDASLKHQDFDAALNALVNLGGAIDEFFDHVLVNTGDEALRQNRLALLGQVKSQFLRVADISKIVIETDNGV